MFSVIVRIGSKTNYTEQLINLENEIRQIRNRNNCPRRYKTKMFEYIFGEKKLYVDWCHFRLLRN